MSGRTIPAAWLLFAGACGATACGDAANREDEPLSAAPAGGEVAPELAALIHKHAQRAAASPQDAGRRGTLGLVYQANQMWPEAREAFEQAHSLAPDEPLWLDHLADALGVLGSDAEAWELLETDGARFRNHPPTLQRLGLARLQQGRFEEARELFTAVARTAPTSPAGYLGLGAALLELGDAEGARDALEAGLERAPDERAGHYLLGRALRDLGQDERALEHLKKGRGGRLAVMSDEADPRLARFAVRAEHRRQRAVRALAGGRPAEAAAILEELRVEEPVDARVALDLGVAYSRLGRTREALAAFTAAATLDPDEQLVHANLSACQLELGRPELALAAAERAVEIAPQLASGHLMRGRALLALEREADARASLERARELAPGDRQVQRALAELDAGHDEAPR